MTEIFLDIVNMSITASILAVVVLLLRLVLKKAPKWISVLLWGLVALRLICPFAVESSFSLMPKTDWIEQETLSEEDLFLDSVPDSIPTGDSSSFGEEITIHYELIENPEIEIHRGVSTTFILACVWIAGMAALFLHAIISTIRLRRSIGAAIRVRDNVWESSAVDSPFVLGLVRPRIYIPRGLSEEKLSYVISHEQAHIRRRDHWWKPLGFLLLTVHWFNPVMWLSYILLCRDIEMACDEKVVRDMGEMERADYSEALLECSVKRSMISACPLAFGEVGVKERIKTVLNYKKPAFWIVGVAVLACAAAAVCFLTNPIDVKDGNTADEQTENTTVCNTVPPDDVWNFAEQSVCAFNGAAGKETVYSPWHFAVSEIYESHPYEITIQNEGAVPLTVHLICTSNDTELASYTAAAGEALFIEKDLSNMWYMEVDAASDTVPFSVTVYGQPRDMDGEKQIFGVPAEWFVEQAWEKAQITAAEKGMVLDHDKPYITFSNNGEYVGVEFYEDDKIKHVRIAFFRDENGKYSMEPPQQTTISTEAITEPNPVIAYQDEIIEKAAESIFGAVTVYASGIDKLEQVPTATVGISEEILLYRLDYWITKGINGLEGTPTEDIYRETVYFAMFHDWTSDTWVRLGTITEAEIDEKYVTAEMISKYGNKYTAAVCEMKQEYYELVRETPVEFTAVIMEFDPAYYEHGMMSLNIVEFITRDDTERIAELELSEQDMISGYYIHDEDESITTLTLPEDTEFIFYDWWDAYTDETDERYEILGERWISTRDAELFYEYWLPYADSPGYPFTFTASDEKVIVKEIPLM